MIPIAERTTILKGWLSVVRLRLQWGDAEVQRYVIDHPSGAAVLAYNAERRVALTLRQPRLAVLHLGCGGLAETIGGVTDPGDGDPAGTARREAMEEAGVHLAELALVGQVWMTPSSTTERVHLYLAEYRDEDRLGAGGGMPEEHEQIVVVEEPLHALWAALDSGAMMDAKLTLLLQALYVRRPDMFVAPPA